MMTSYTWTGSDGSNWSDPNNWSPAGGPPGASDDATIGSAATVDGANAEANNLYVTASATFAGLFTANNAYISANLSLGGSLLTNTFLSVVEDVLTVNDGGALASDGPVATRAAVQVDDGGSIEVDGGAFQEDGSGVLIGYDNKGGLTIEDGGSADFASSTDSVAVFTIGDDSGSYGVVTVEGDQSTLKTSVGGDNVGYYGDGYLTIQDGAAATDDGGVFFGSQDGAYGEADVENGSQFEVSSGPFVIGDDGQGQVNVDQTSSLDDQDTTDGVVIASQQGSTGDLSDMGSLTLAGPLVVGDGGDGTLEILNGGNAAANSLDIAEQNTSGDPSASSPSMVTVAGAPSNSSGNTLTLITGISVGVAGYGELEVEDGATVSADSVEIASQSTSGSEDDDAPSIITIGGDGSQLMIAADITVGDAGYGELAISNGATATADAIDVASQSSSGDTTTHQPSYVSVDGDGSTLTLSGEMTVGDGGYGALAITDGGAATASGLDVALQQSSGDDGDDVFSLVKVDASGSSLTIKGDGFVGDGGLGALTIEDGATATLQSLNIAAQDTSGSSADDAPSYVGVGDSGSSLAVAGGIFVGGAGFGNLTVVAGAVVSGDTIDVATQTSSAGSWVSVDGAKAELSLTGDAFVGDGGQGYINIADGGALNAGALDVAVQASSGDPSTLTPSFISVSGDGSKLVASDDAVVGDAGYGALSLTGSGAGTIDGDLTIGGQETSGDAADAAPSYVEVSGDGSTLSVSGSTTIGDSGDGELSLTGGGAFATGGDTLEIASQEGSAGLLYVDGSDTDFQFSGQIVVGDGGRGLMEIEDGASVEADSLDVAAQDTSGAYGLAHSPGTPVTGSPSGAYVDGDDSALTVNGAAIVGDAGFGYVDVWGGATMTAASVDVAAQASSGDPNVLDESFIEVDNSGSKLNVNGDATVGDAGYGALTVFDGAAATIGGDLFMASQAGSGDAELSAPDFVVIDGADSRLTVTGATTVGDGGDAALTVSNGAAYVTNGATMEIAAQMGSTGAVTVEDDGSTLNAMNLVIGGSPTAAGGAGSLTASQGGGVDVDDSILIWGGAINVANGGMLSVGAGPAGAAMSAVDVQSSGSISGYGTITGSLSDDGAVFASDGLLELDGAVGPGVGALTIEAGATLQLDGAVASDMTPTFAAPHATLRLEQNIDVSVAGFAVGDTIDLAGLAFKSSYEAVWNASAFQIVDAAAGNAVVATLALSGSAAGAVLTLAQDATGGTNVSLAPAVPDDFNGDGKSDLLIESAAGAVVTGEVANGALTYAQVAGLGPDWKFSGNGDFLGAGGEGFLVENASGSVFVGAVVGGAASYTQVAGLGPEWAFRGTGDFFNDGQDQFLIESVSGPTQGAVVVGNVVSGQAQYSLVTALGPEWSFEGTGDFLGDGKTDFLIENTSGAVDVGEISNDAATYTNVGALGPEWKFVGTGDFLGNGQDQFLIENTSGALDVANVVNGEAQYTNVGALGSEWSFLGTGDYLGAETDGFMIENAAGAVVLGTVVNGAASYQQVGALGPEWTSHR